MARDFDWHNEESKEDIIFPTVQAVAVYSNPRGDVVIRQQDSMGNDDSFIVVPRTHVDALLTAIAAVAKAEL